MPAELERYFRNTFKRETDGTILTACQSVDSDDTLSSPQFRRYSGDDVLSFIDDQASKKHNHINMTDFEVEFDGNNAFHPEKVQFGASMLTRSSHEIFDACKPSKLLLDLVGDYDSHIRSLIYGHCYRMQPLSWYPASFLSTQLQNQNPLQTYPQMMTYDIPGQVYPVSHQAFVCSEVNAKLQGTGPFFPPMVCIVLTRPS